MTATGVVFVGVTTCTVVLLAATPLTVYEVLDAPLVPVSVIVHDVLRGTLDATVAAGSLALMWTGDTTLAPAPAQLTVKSKVGSMPTAPPPDSAFFSVIEPS